VPSSTRPVDNLVYTRTWVGNADDSADAITLDSRGAAYVAAYTSPLTSPPRRARMTGRFGGVRDGYVTRLAPNGGSLSTAPSSWDRQRLRSVV